MFEPDPGLMIWTVVSFLLLLALLKQFAYKPILDLMEGREKSIKNAIDDSERGRAEAESLLFEYKKQLEEGRGEVQKMIEEGRAAGEILRKEILSKASEESKDLVKKAQEEIEREKQKALIELQAQVAELSIQVASKMVQNNLSAQDHNKLIEGALDQVKEAYGKV
ncbi:MAG: F0F1 ATP synthase subunit B [Nitrospira sp.]|nr:F0F1 ATP synthase subunit B [Candidatus Manganitrophaceae bacterium]HIL35476.1 ATP synthase F0 subunit B [Candidatus Manganitrophaceae bacterium]